MIGVMKNRGVAIQRDADTRTGTIVDFRTQFPKYAFGLLEIDIATDGMFIQRVQDLAVVVIHRLTFLVGVVSAILTYQT